ncbi:MAG: DUF1993 domain-containing protein [Gammaproteobacteria bacterium]|nr:DUF1993 domain-containing protein [Gammaproteobacteria bacterium]
MTIFDQVVTGFSRSLQNLAVVLDKADQHAKANKYEMAALLDARLYPDMFSCKRQIQLATDFAKGSAGRLAGVEVPTWEDTESTCAELHARLKKAMVFLATLQPEQFADAPTRAIEIKTPVGTFNFTGSAFLLQWAVPNFYFHVTTAYNLLRHNGVPIGKFDFLGNL